MIVRYFSRNAFFSSQKLRPTSPLRLLLQNCDLHMERCFLYSNNNQLLESSTFDLFENSDLKFRCFFQESYFLTVRLGLGGLDSIWMLKKIAGIIFG